MFKHDTMAQYVADRAPRLAPRAPRQPLVGSALTAAFGGRRDGAVVISLDTRRMIADPVVVEAFSLDAPTPA